LITDDDKDDSEFLTDALTQTGFPGTIRVFGNGEELINHLTTSSPRFEADLIVLDLNMPTKNGYETLKELKQHSDLKDITVVILTSSPRIQDEKYCYELGCKYFLRKPLNYSGYVEVAKEIIRLTKA
jgi:CheY-like chemotaxis protein